ncbi:hypothetical protein [Rufibacter soli]
MSLFVSMKPRYRKLSPQVVFLVLLFTLLESSTVWALPKPDKDARQAPPNGREQVHLRFSQPFYASGDTVRFKAFIVKEGSLQASANSKVLEVSFKTSSRATSQHLRFPIVQGMAVGGFVLADSLARGQYEVTAYGAGQAGEKEGIFRQRIRVLGPATEKAKAEESAVSSVTLEGFPEGGRLIAGVENKLALKATDQNGTPTAATGNITASDGSITSFQTDANGQGFILLTPPEAGAYQITLENQKVPALLKLPAVEPLGIALRISATTDSLLQIKLLPSPNWLKNVSDKNVRVTVMAGDRELMILGTKVTQPQGVLLKITRQSLPAGPLKMIVTNARDQIEAERYLIFGHLQQVKVHLKTDRVSYGRREPVRLTAHVTDAAGKPLEASLSFVVRTRGQVQNQAMEAEFIKGAVPAYPLAELGAGPAFQSTQEWALLVEGAPTVVLPGKNLEPKEPATAQPYAGMTLAGRILDANQRPLPAATVLLYSRASTEPMFQVTDGAGHFSFQSLEFNNPGHYVTEVLRGGLRLKEAVIEWAQGPNVEPVAPLPLKVTEQEALYLRQAAIREQAHLLFTRKQAQAQTAAPDTIPSALLGALGRPDKSYDLSQYTPFKDLADMVKETIPLASVVGNGQVKEVRIFSPEKAGARYPEHPLYLVNGQPVSNNEWVLNLPGAAIKQIDLFYTQSKLSNIGLIGRYGVLSITTHPPYPQPQEMQDNNSFTWTGLTTPFTFQTPSYEYTLPRPDPDFRSLLYWAPAVKTNAAGAATLVFYTSDDVGEFEVEVEAYHPKGLVGSQRQVFTIVASF